MRRAKRLNRNLAHSSPLKSGVATSVLLVASALLGIAILSTDYNLWTYEPAHAYGLIAFVAIDLVAIGLVSWRGTRNVLRLAGAWGAIFALIMVSDIFSGGANAFGLSPEQFAIYLFGLGYYDSAHIALLFPALFVVNILAAIVGFWETRGMGTAASTGSP